MRLARIGFDKCIGYINIDNEDQILSFSKPNSLKCVNPSDFIKSFEKTVDSKLTKYMILIIIQITLMQFHPIT